MSKSAVQQCPICKVSHPLKRARCDRCGAVLPGTALDGPGASRPPAPKRRAGSRMRRPPRLDGPQSDQWALGEADLHEGLLPASPFRNVVFFSTALFVVVGIGLIIYLVAQNAADALPNAPAAANLNVTVLPNATTPSAGNVGTGRVRGSPPPTNTRVMVIALVPTLNLPTVTAQPPSPTTTPTRGPCLQTAAANDTVFGMAGRCGHRDFAVVNEVLRVNNMAGASQLQVGQVLEIPWPTETFSPAEVANAEPTEGSELGMEPTLIPSLRWYVVRKGQTASDLIFELNINVKILRDLNPETRFEGCDFGLPTGGPQCNIPLFEGQRLRVPAPPPTPTLSPTPSGSETPTPTITPTFNAPFSQSPSNNMLFEAYELPTLRWVATGQLNPDEVYLVTVTDQTLNVTYYATTRDLSFQLPLAWQPTAGKRHIFAWMVTIATLKEGTNAIPSTISTETRTLSWQSR